MEMLTPMLWGACLFAAFISGVVKGALGFGMPMLILAGVGLFVQPELAIVALIAPTLVSNLWQALRGGRHSLVQAMHPRRFFIVITLITIFLSAQLVPLLRVQTLFILIGVPITVFSLLQLFGYRPTLGAHENRVRDGTVGLVVGFMGGLTASFGPPTVLYLTALGTTKSAQVQIQGALFGLGALTLIAAHSVSGFFTTEGLLFSLVLLAPALAGMRVGFLIHDKLNQTRFLNATLVLLVLAGLNFLRRGFLG